MEEREEDKSLALRQKKLPLGTPNLVCPILSLRPSVEPDYKLCLGKRCALYVEGHKETLIPARYLFYEGCGLVGNIFWEQRKTNHVRP